MPSTSEKQARFMAAAAHDPDFAKRNGIPQSVAKEFNQADTGTQRLSRANAQTSRRSLYNHAKSRKAADDAS